MTEQVTAQRIFEPIPPEVEKIGRMVIGCGIAVHRYFGPGYKEAIYVESMCLEMDSRGINYERETSILVYYKGRPVGSHRLDLLIEGALILECKVAECLLKVHTRQVVSYLKATDLRLGYVFNFNVDVLTEGGIKRVVR